ncbi:MAG TPA: 16S rRNA methyltransferase, partial [Rhabdochlamydiaceae bacterium]
MTLLLLPNLLGEGLSHELYMPISVDRAVASIKGLIVEDEKEGRRYLKMFGQDFRNTPMQVLSEHTQDKDLDTLLAPLLKGERWGLISDCGL